MTRQQVVVATRNAGKLHELAPMLEEAGLEPVGLTALGLAESADEEELERFATFEENALAKAHHFAERSGGLPVIADDSGLAVEALGGAPGVRSKRWSGRTDLSGRALDAANNAKLLAALEGTDRPAAAFVCAAAWVGEGITLVRRGEVRGQIVREARGAEGFGYDPHFEAAELGRTLAECSREEKAGVSHRGRAVRALLAALREAGAL